MDILQKASAFCIEGTPVCAVPFGNGHINRTYKVDTDTSHSYVLQHINKYVFQDPVRLMENIGAVTNFLRQKSSEPYITLRFLTCENGTICYEDSDGEFWRCYDYVPGFSVDTPEQPGDLYQCALAFGRFQNLLSDFPAQTLYETIPEFHNTIDRYRKLKASIKKDVKGRVAAVGEEIALSLRMETLGSQLQLMRERGELPLRVTHNDTKMNNALLRTEDRTSLCVIDLDTVMPGLSAYDFGDSIRSGASSAAEDSEGAVLDLGLFEEYARGYLEAVPSLTDAEIRVLPLGAFTMTLEVGIRFLTDYLDGDVYFRTRYPDQNLHAARSQLFLAADIESKFNKMETIIARIVSERSQTCNI